MKSVVLDNFAFLSFILSFYGIFAVKNFVSESVELQNVYASDPDYYSPIRVCYFTTWARYRSPPFNYFPRDVDPRLCSHIIVAFAWITNGSLTLQSESDDKPIVDGLLSWKNTVPNIKIMAAVGGWTFGSVPFRYVVGSAENRTRFVNSSISFLENWGLDGLDLDWEYPEWKEKDNFTLLLKEFRENLDAHGVEQEAEPFIFSAAVPCSMQRMGGYDVKLHKNYFDFINLMCYDMHGPWNNATGHNAPLKSWDGYNVKAGVREWTRRGMPPNKIILGLPLYGHSFQLSNVDITEPGGVSIQGVSGSITNSPGFFSYYEVCSFLKENGTEVLWDKLGTVPYAVNDDIWVSYDNEASLTRKVKWSLNEGLGGIMVWSLGMDDCTGRVCHENVTYPLLKAINIALGFNVSRIDPNGANVINNSVERENAEHNLGVVKGHGGPRHSKKQENSDEDTTGVKDGDSCNWDHIPRPAEDCRHFTVCSHGKISTQLCPSGLVFSPENSICMWGWEVPECEHAAEHAPTTPPTPKQEIEIPQRRIIEINGTIVNVSPLNYTAEADSTVEG